MHMPAVVEMTVIDIESADQLVLVGVGNADAEVSGIPEWVGVEVITEKPIRGKNSRTIL